ncbi:MAG TPA: peptide chain release factor N(5)-glutamine methyltransferase [Epulopiscium sp.]|nr:peptide chain release factor N(5)-glutamine methyltransferase [Candidatus Epulonipiscium sp.]
MDQQERRPKQSQLVTVHQLVKEGHEALKDANKQNAMIDAELLALHALGYTRLERILNSNLGVSEQDQKTYRDYISKRCSGIPLQYIINEQEFMGLPFYVDPNVLIPRQDTETLVEVLIEKSKKQSFNKIVEVGVGSGCISISLAKFLPSSRITGIDISDKALEIAKRNAKKNQVEDRIQWSCGDLLNGYQSDEKVDLVVSNPPYITSKDCTELDEDVKEHEPMLALDGGEDGLRFYRDITKQAKNHLRQGGMLAYEIGYNQSKDVRDIMEENGFVQIEEIKDLAYKDRIVLGILDDGLTKQTKR